MLSRARGFRKNGNHLFILKRQLDLKIWDSDSDISSSRKKKSTKEKRKEQ
jgi:hypothetical protein